MEQVKHPTAKQSVLAWSVLGALTAACTLLFDRYSFRSARSPRSPIEIATWFACFTVCGGLNGFVLHRFQLASRFSRVVARNRFRWFAVYAALMLGLAYALWRMAAR